DEQARNGRVSIAHCSLPPSVATACERLREAFADLPYAGEYVPKIAAHYAPGRSIAGAFAGLLAELFSDEGLVIFDPRQPQVAQLAAPIYKTALERCAEIDERLLARGAALRAAGMDEQIRVRAGTTLVFAHDGSARGPR